MSCHERAGTPASATPAGPGRPATPAVPIADVDASVARARPTGLGELDRVLGGGLVPGAVVLLAGEPGVGKSTLLLEAGALAAGQGRVLYVTGEESAAQVRLRADRVGAISQHLFLAAETDFGALLEHVDAVKPDLLIVDSVQTISVQSIDGTPGGVAQVREVTSALTALAKQRTLTTVLVGHVTKDGSIAGPRSLEHLVDVVLHFDGDRHAQLRMVRALKNRFGPTDEIGCFELGEYGLAELPDPSGLFLSRLRDPVPGTCVTVTLEGRRPLLAEVQTLVCDCTGEPRRVTSGLDWPRVGMVVAVLQRRARVTIGKKDIYAATVGGVRLTEPSVDLAIALALASATSDLSLPAGLIAVGEVGLAGDRDDHEPLADVEVQVGGDDLLAVDRRVGQGVEVDDLQAGGDGDLTVAGHVVVVGVLGGGTLEQHRSGLGERGDQVDMAVGGDDVVFHGRAPSEDDHPSSRSASPALPCA